MTDTAFVLGGGGLLGAVEVGMLRALFDADIRPDLILGTSVGALNGALVAAHPGPDVIQRLVALWQGGGRWREGGGGGAGGRRGPGGVRRWCRAPGDPGRPHRHPPALEPPVAGTPAPGARRPELRRPRRTLPVLRRQHRTGRGALVHAGPGRRRGRRLGRRTGAAPTRCRGR